jgi:hypothetical protein
MKTFTVMKERRYSDSIVKQERKLILANYQEYGVPEEVATNNGRGYYTERQIAKAIWKWRRDNGIPYDGLKR